MDKNSLLLTDKRIRELVSRWFPVSQESFTFAYKGDIKEVARDFAFHIAAAQLAKAKPIIEKQGFTKGIEHYRKVILPIMIEEAVKAERERIYGEIAEKGIIGNYNATGKYLCDLTPLIQALKGE